MFMAYKNTINGRFLIVGVVKDDLPETSPGNPKYGQMIPFGWDMQQRGQIPLVDFVIPLCADNEDDLREMLDVVIAEITHDDEAAEVPAPRAGDHDQDEPTSDVQLHDLASAVKRIHDLERQLETERQFGALISTGGSLSDLTGPDSTTEDES